MSTVAIIPARGGSKGLPRKNLRLLDGEPLVARTVRAARAAKRIDRVIVSTDDRRIAAAARRAGAEVPFERPGSLAGDEVATVPVVEHAVAWLEDSGATVDLVVTLQPTSPLRDAAEIDAAVALLDDPEVDSAVSVAAVSLPLSVLGTIRDGRFSRLAEPEDVRRQAGPQVHRITGGVYVTRRSLLASGRLLGDAPAALVVDAERAIDIDDAADLLAARRVLARSAR